MARWRPFETAPRDGTHVLLGWQNERGRGSVQAYYDEDRDEWHELNHHSTDAWGDAIDTGDVTHWMPLPQPPASGGRS